MGSNDNVAYDNHIVINGLEEKYAIYLYRGDDVPEVEGSDGRPRRNHIYENYLIADGDAVKIMEADDNIIEVKSDPTPLLMNFVCMRCATRS